jgi:hypothetical protein
MNQTTHIKLYNNCSNCKKKPFCHLEQSYLNIAKGEILDSSPFVMYVHCTNFQPKNNKLKVIK